MKATTIMLSTASIERKNEAHVLLNSLSIADATGTKKWWSASGGAPVAFFIPGG